jgi:uncharacterized membrane protein
MLAWLRTHPILATHGVAAAAYGLMWLLFLTPLLKGDGAWTVWGLLAAVIGCAVWAMFRVGLGGVAQLLILVAVAVFGWILTAFRLACSAYGECM